MTIEGKNHQGSYITMHLRSLIVSYPCCPTLFTPPPHPVGRGSVGPYLHAFMSRVGWIVDTSTYILSSCGSGLLQLLSMYGSQCRGWYNTLHTHIDIIIAMHLLSLTMSSPCCQPTANPSCGMKGNCGPYLLPFMSWVGLIAYAFTCRTLSLCRNKLLQHICVCYMKGTRQSKSPFACTWLLRVGAIRIDTQPCIIPLYVIVHLHSIIMCCPIASLPQSPTPIWKCEPYLLPFMS